MTNICLFYQGLLLPRQCRRSDAARALPARRPDWSWYSTARPTDQHTEPRRSCVRCYHKQPHTSCLHWWQRLCQNLGHQPTWQQEPGVPTGLSGEHRCWFTFHSTATFLLLVLFVYMCYEGYELYKQTTFLSQWDNPLLYIRTTIGTQPPDSFSANALVHKCRLSFRLMWEIQVWVRLVTTKGEKD